MSRIQPSSSLLRSALAALLLLAMLAGQWAGLEHRVRHGGRDMALAHIVAGSSDHGDEGYAHSCQLFDAATLALGIRAAFYTAPCERPAQDWRLPSSPRAWHPRFTAYFSSRAPPLD